MNVSPRRARILVVIERVKGWRNFVGAGAFATLAARHELHYASPPAGDPQMRDDPRDFVEAAPWHPVEPDARRAADWARLAFTGQVRPAFSGYRRRLRRMRLLPLSRRERLLQTALALPGPRWVYAALLRRRLLGGSAASLDRLLDAQRPDIVLHPSILSGVLLNDLLLACRRRAIPSVVLMDSWDNPSTKNATFVPPDWLVVWGEQTHRHAVKYMRLPPERVVPLGAPQHEVMRRADIAAARATCREQHGLGAEETVVLYAASTIGAGDFAALRALEAAVDSGQLPPCRFLYRGYPEEAENQESDRIRAHDWNHVLVQRDGLQRSGADGRSDSALRHAEETARIGALAAADAVISPLSTILLEAAMLGRPVLCYFPEEEARPAFRRANAPFVHFDEFLAIPEVVTAERADRLVAATGTMLRQVEGREAAVRLRVACRYFVAEFASSYADRLANFVEAILPARLAASEAAVQTRRAA